MRPTERGAPGRLAPTRSAEGSTNTEILAAVAAAGKQAALHVWAIEFAVSLQRADVALLALAFVWGAS